MSRSRMAVPGLTLRYLRNGIAASVLVAILVALGSLAVSLAPRALAQLGTAQLRHTVQTISAPQRELTASGTFGEPLFGGHPPTTLQQMFGTFSSILDAVPAESGPPLSAALKKPDWVIQTEQQAADPIGRQVELHPVVSLAVDPDWTGRVRIVEGTAPATWTGRDSDDLDPAAQPPIEIALSAASAKLAGLHVGDILDGQPARLLISALYEPKDPKAEYWQHIRELATGDIFTSTNGTLLYASAFVDPATSIGLRITMDTAKVTAWYPLDLNRLRFGDIDTLAIQVRELEAAGQSLPGNGGVEFSWGLPQVLVQIEARIALISSLLALVAAGPVCVVIVAIALGVQSVVTRRRPSLTLLRSRGGSLAQLRALGIVEGVLISLPAAVLGVAVAMWITPGDAGPQALVLPAVFALTPPIVFAVLAPDRSHNPARADLRVRSRSGARWVLEVAALALAALSVLLLFRRGLVQTSLQVGVDPLLVATPVLLALAVCVLVLRAYPGIMRGIQRIARARRDAVSLIGPARAVRRPALGFVAALALILGISTAVFSTVLSTTVEAALTADARSAVGADARVEADSLGPDVQADVSAIDGVAGVAAVERDPNVVVEAADVPTTVTVVIADLADLARVRPDLGLRAGTGEFPVWVSRELARTVASAPITVDGHAARITGHLPSNAIPGAGSSWVLIDATDADRVGTRFEPDALLLSYASGADSSSTTSHVVAAVRGGQTGNDVRSVTAVQVHALLATATSDPATSDLETALHLAAVIAALLSMLVVVLATVSSAGGRNVLVGVLRVLGVSARQVRRLTVWELVPITLTAVAAGTLLGIAELWIVSAAVDLRPFIAGSAAPSPTVDPIAVAAVVIAFAAAAALVGLLAVEVGRRASTTSSIKMGAE